MLLSILIPSVPERATQLQSLLASLAPQVQQAPGLVEVLVLTDLKTMSLGEKRNRLMGVARGQFFIHLDDDDRLVPYTVTTLLPIISANPAIDVIAYDQRCTLRLKDETAEFRVTTSIHFDNETAHKNDDGVWADLKRKPWHWNAWRAELAKSAEFVGRVDEDWQWLQHVLPEVKHQYKLDQVLHEYHFDSTNSLCGAEEPKL